MKVVINSCYGGFGLSDRAYSWLIKERGWAVTDFDEDGNYTNPDALISDCGEGDNFGRYYFVKDRSDISLRTNQDLIDCVEALGDKADGDYASLEIIEVPDNIDVYIDEYDGIEAVAEVHRRWC